MTHPVRRRGSTLCTVIALVAAMGLAGCGTTQRVEAGAGAGGRPQPDVFTPLIVSTVARTTAPVRGTDDRMHVVYELLLTNGHLAPATIDRIQVLDAAERDEVLADYEGAAIVDNLRTLRPAPAEDATIEPNGSRMFYIQLTFDRPSDVPDAVVHHLDLQGAANPGTDQPTPLSYTVGRFNLHRKVPVVAAPLKGGGWIAANGCCNSDIIHRGSSQTVNGQLFFAQRFAIDWLRLDDEGRVVDGDPLLVESWTAYGADLFAAADGTVVGVLDGLPDQIPGQLPDPSTLNIENIDGNHVVLDLGDGFFAFYAHMKPGSVAVELGDRVEKGDFLGHLGNSGNTSAPHLHFHVVDSASVIGSDGLPYVFDRFAYEGQVDIDRWNAATTLEGRWDQGRIPPEPRRDQFPLNLNIIAFPDS